MAVCTLDFAIRSYRSCFLDPPLLFERHRTTSRGFSPGAPVAVRASVAAFLRQWPIAVADLILALGWNMEKRGGQQRGSVDSE